MKKPSIQSQVAKLIRTELKAHNISAKVIAKDINTIYIETKNLPPAERKKLNEITAKYKLKNYNPNLLQIEYILISEEIDEEIYQKALDYLANNWNEPQWSLEQVYEKGNHITPDRLDEQTKIKMLMNDTVYDNEKFWETL